MGFDINFVVFEKFKIALKIMLFTYRKSGHENSLKLTIRSWELTEELGKNHKFLI